MRVKKGFNLREVCGEQIIVAEGEENIDFSNIVSMNESSSELWKEAQRLKEFTIQDLVNHLLSIYEVDEQTAKTDVTNLVAQWGKACIIEGDDIPEVAEDVLNEVMEKTPYFADVATKYAAKAASKPSKKGFFRRLFGK